MAVSRLLKAGVCAFLFSTSSASVAQSPAANAINQPAFQQIALEGHALDAPTVLSFGPDGRLYVAEQNGTISAHTLVRLDGPRYVVEDLEVIDLIGTGIANHFDDGTPSDQVGRQVTGMFVTGTADVPVLYVSSSDPNIGAGTSEQDLGLDTNSGVLSQLVWQPASGQWQKTDLLRGLPRSEENHAVNGLALSQDGTRLYLAVGGHTNSGAPSAEFAYLTEYALSAAVLEIDLPSLEAMPVKDVGGQRVIYDLPTLDDPSRPNQSDGSDVGDPFGGNDGLNQAVLEKNGPVRLYATGLRNAYDLLHLSSGGLITIDNGGNPGWGYPVDTDENGHCTTRLIADTERDEGAETLNIDGLHLLSDGYYGGHPNPLRANPDIAGLLTGNDDAQVWRNSNTAEAQLPTDWPPVSAAMADPRECQYLRPGIEDGALLTWEGSTNGLAEYTASNFGGAMTGWVLSANLRGPLFQFEVTENTDTAVPAQAIDHGVFADDFAVAPLDVTTQGDEGAFPGTIWVASIGDGEITIFEPLDYNGAAPTACSAQDSTALDEDYDGYHNAQERRAGSNPCDVASLPLDSDADFLADVVDSDDDNDAIADAQDPFQLDASNGRETALPLRLSFRRNAGGFHGTGFTGLMLAPSNEESTAPTADLRLNPAQGRLSILNVGKGSPFGTENTLRHGYQLGLDSYSKTEPFTVTARLDAPFFEGNAGVQDPEVDGTRFQGIALSDGSQDNFMSIALSQTDRALGLHIHLEKDGKPRISLPVEPEDLEGADWVKLAITVNPADSTVALSYQVPGKSPAELGAAITVNGALKLGMRKRSAPLAAGLWASAGTGRHFAAHWGDFTVKSGSGIRSDWFRAPLFGANTAEERHDHAVVAVDDKLYILGGRGSFEVDIFDIATSTWRKGPRPPADIHHYQGVAIGTKIYAVGAYTGRFPTETPVSHVFVYDTLLDEWQVGDEIPRARRRGAGGTVAKDGIIYWVGGLTDGHVSGWSSKFDAYDPATGQWSVLPDAPRARDHFFASLIGESLYLAGGRISAWDGDGYGPATDQVDVFDFANSQWRTLEGKMPNARAAGATAAVGRELFIVGGLNDGTDTARSDTSILDVVSEEWRSGPTLERPRHAAAMVAVGDTIYHYGGAADRQAIDKLNLLETLEVNAKPLPAKTVEEAAQTPPEAGTSGWQFQQFSTPSEAPLPRNTGSLARLSDQLIFLGGRFGAPAQHSTAETGVWTQTTPPPVALHHSQAVVVDGLVYFIGGMLGGYPNETTLEHILIYDPDRARWFAGPSFPQGRARASAGAVYADGRIYVIGGTQDGHLGKGGVAWLDVFDPVLGTWTQLEDAPRRRDHFEAVAHNGKIYVVAGAQLNPGGGPANNFPAEVDVYDIKSGQWQADVATLPEPRSEAAAIVIGKELLVIGGRRAGVKPGFARVDALDLERLTWRRLPDLNQGRRGGVAGILGGDLVVLGGASTSVFDADLTSQERIPVATILAGQSNE